MAIITLSKRKLKRNYDALETLFVKNDISWGIVTKLLCGHEEFIQAVIDMGVKQVCDSRVSNLKMIKSISNDVETIYIKPPPKRSVSSIVKYADISVNTEIDTIKLLSKEAKKQNKTHKVLIMIELGELREGVMKEDFIAFYHEVFKLPNISVIGIGTNLTCMYGVLPSHDKLIQLCLYEQLIEAKFDKNIEYVSGGSSVTIPLIFQNLLPKGINHFRVGETFFLGTDVYNSQPFKKMESNVFQLFAEIIELSEKPRIPVGEIGQNLLGEKVAFESTDYGETSYRAIIDLGLLDIEQNHINLKDKEISIVGASSDMIVLDLKENKQGYKVGDLLEFEMDYMGVLRIMNSRYIEKRVIE